MIRRQEAMRFLGGFYAFPGGRVSPVDATPETVARVRGLDAETAAGRLRNEEGLPSLAFWVAAIRELFEETGVLMACDAQGAPIDHRDPSVADQVERSRKALMAGEAGVAALLAPGGGVFGGGPPRHPAPLITPPPGPLP